MYSPGKGLYLLISTLLGAHSESAFRERANDSCKRLRPSMSFGFEVVGTDDSVRQAGRGIEG